MAKAKEKLSRVASDVYGVVKWFNKGSGRITIKDYGDIFVHFRQIKKPSPKCYGPQKFLVKGQTVKCDLISGPKGIQASKVVVVIDTSVNDDSRSQTSEVADSASVCSDYYESSSDSEDETPAKRCDILERDLRGEVLSYNKPRGFGFVKTHQYGNIFCHYTDILFSGDDVEKVLTPTQFVRCDVARGEKGLMAVNVHVICEASPAVKSRDSSASRLPPKAEESKKGQKQAKKAEQPKKAEKQHPKKSKGPAKKPEEAQSKPKSEQIPNVSASNPSKGDSANPVLHSDVFGEVLHYNTVKNFGFIKVPIHGSVFVHKNGLVNCDQLLAKQVVKFDIIRGPKTLMATNLKVLSDGAPPESAAPITEDKKGPEESKTKKKKVRQKAQEVPPLMPQPVPAPRPSKKQQPPTSAGPFMHPSAPPPSNPFFDGPPAPGPTYPYPQPPMAGPNYPYGPPPPYMHPGPPPPPPQMQPPPYPGQVAYLPTMMNKAHISQPTMQDPFAKPKDPKASTDRQLHEGIAKELVCGICEDLLEDPVITPCDHLFCRGCLLEWLPYNAQCPIDRKSLSKEEMKDAPRAIKNLISKA